MAAVHATIAAVHIGRPQTYLDEAAGDDRPAQWRTAIFKTPADGPLTLSKLGLAGDEVADRRNHGGIDGAVLAYAASHYKLWANELPDKRMGYGGFGENLTIDGLTEENVAIGDRWRIGDAVLEVSKPRQPCWKLCRRWNQPDLAKRVAQSGRGGWYLRVKSPGVLTAGDAMELAARPHPEWTIMRVQRLFYGLDRDPAAARQLASLPALSLEWREAILNRSA